MTPPWGQCRRCMRVTYRRGVCPTCRTEGEYGPVDRIECVPHGQTARLVRELDRVGRERDEFRRLFQSARYEGDKLLARLRRSERLEATMERLERASRRAREAV